jgi:hypothetical protein
MASIGPFSNTTILIVVGAVVLYYWYTCQKNHSISKFTDLSVPNGNVTLIGSKFPASVSVGGMQPAALSVATEYMPLPYFDPMAASAYAELIISESGPNDGAATEAVATNQPMAVTTVPVEIPTYRVNIPSIETVNNPTTSVTTVPSLTVQGAPSPWASNLDGSLYFPFAGGIDSTTSEATTTVSTTTVATGPLMTIPATSTGAQAAAGTTGAATMVGSNMPKTPADTNVSYNTILNVDYPGNDMMCEMYDGPNGDPSVCASSCQSDPKCRGYANISANTNPVFPQGFCCTKHTMSDPIASNGVTSYAKMNMSPQ